MILVEKPAQKPDLSSSSKIGDFLEQNFILGDHNLIHTRSENSASKSIIRRTTNAEFVRRPENVVQYTKTKILKLCT